MTATPAAHIRSRYLDVSSAPGLWLGALTVFGGIVRWLVTRNEGIWRDEGLFLAIVRLPRWHDTIEFLRFHESHPPLFYALVRSWMAITGNSDESSLAFVIILGTLLVPVTYWAGRGLYSARVGAIAAFLAAISPILVEYAAMVRPYPLLQILIVVATYSLAFALQNASLKWWFVFALSTLGMLYTHNWAWLIAAGHGVGFAIFVFSDLRNRRHQLFQGLAATLVIGLVFAPWASTLLYQSAHAGYNALAVDIWHFILITPFALQATILPAVGNPLQRFIAAIGELFFVMSAGALWLIRRWSRQHVPRAASIGTSWKSIASIGTMLIVSVSVTSLLLALILSTHSNLLQPRCMSILTPLGLIGIAAAIDHHWRTSRHVADRVGLACGVAALLVLYGAGIVRLLTSHKSNAREIAAAVTARSTPRDIIILMPEWLASSYNRYYKPGNAQIDYPREGREDAVDFAGLMPRLRDTAALTRAIVRVNEARAQGRRVWLISERPYFLPLTSKNKEDLHKIDLMKPHDSLLIHIRLQQVRNTLISVYGKPDTTLARGKPRDRYEHLIAYLFSPPTADSSSGRATR